jgi:calreticulin
MFHAAQVDEPKIADPEDIKPEGYDDIPREIPDPDATKPDDWDDEEDGEWEPPLVDNPEYMGEWKPKMIDNPDYKGPWEHPLIPNPEYFEDPKLHKRCDKCKFVGFELWQVLSGTLFDDIIVTDSLEEAQAFAKETFWVKSEQEKSMFDKQEEERRSKEREEREQKRKETQSEEDDEDEEDEHDEL